MSQVDVLTAFNRVSPINAEQFLLALPSSIKLPAGADGGAFNYYHQQGFQKTSQGGFIVSGSADSQGYFYTTDSSNTILKVLTVPDAYKSYNHMGGCQVCNGVLAVGCEDYDEGANGTSVVLFYTLADLSNPLLTSTTIVRDSDGLTAGEVGITNYDGGWLVAVGNWNCNSLTFYKNKTGNISDGFDAFALWNKSSGLATGSIDTDWAEYQNVNLFTDSYSNLYLIGMLTQGSENEDIAELYSVVLPSNAGGDVTMTKIARQHFTRSEDGPRFEYGSGYYRNTDGTFEVYACSGHIDKIHGKHVSRCNHWTSPQS